MVVRKRWRKVLAFPPPLRLLYAELLLTTWRSCQCRNSLLEKGVFTNAFTRRCDKSNLMSLSPVNYVSLQLHYVVIAYLSVSGCSVKYFCNYLFWESNVFATGTLLSQSSSCCFQHKLIQPIIFSLFFLQFFYLLFCKIWVLQESIIVNKLFLYPNILGVHH